MPNLLSANALQALFSEESDSAFIILLTLTHPTFAQPIRVSSDSVDTVSRGNLFIAYPFDLILPSDDDQQLPEAKITIDNVDRSIVAGLRSVSTPIKVLIEIVLDATLDTVELSFPDMVLRDVQYDDLQIVGSLRFDDILAEPFPGDLVTPATFPGVFF